MTPRDDCSGFKEKTRTLHRITKIIVNENGDIYFGTKGDASESGDNCLISATAVEGKVLAIIYDSEIKR